MKKIHLYTTITLLLLTSCTEFLSQGVDELFITINSPKDSLYSRSDIVNFWWQDDRLVERYEYQLVTPTFDNPFVLIDTLLTENLISIELDEGLYTWRLRANNEESTSTWQIRTFILDDTVPFGATASHPRNGDKSAQDNFQAVLEWVSADQPINDVQFPTWDSIYLYSWRDSVLSPLGEYKVDLYESRKIDIATDLPGVAPGDTSVYRWLVKTFDQAGNEKLSQSFEFSLWN